MELPQQAVNALIQRTTESSSESESHLPLNPNTLYANSLLQQFVAQTQLLNAPTSLQTNSTEVPSFQTATQPTDLGGAKVHESGEAVKRKRGRPKKASNEPKAETGKSSSSSMLNLEYCGNPNVSPDSGIQNSSDHVSSPEPSPTPNSKKFKEEPEMHKNNGGVDAKSKSNTSKTSASKLSVREQPKLPITSNSFDRVLYGNADRILYPPRRKAGRPPISRKGPGRPPKQKLTSSVVPPEPKPPDKPEPTKISAKPVRMKTVPIKEAPVKKTKSSALLEICHRVSKRLDSNNKHSHKPVILSSGKNKKSNNKVVKSGKSGCSKELVLTAKGKIDLKSKFRTLKNSKVMHSRHKNKKHKKCQIRILKPISATLCDPKLNTEIERLVTDFVKLCNISPCKPAKENVPEMLKIMKKASKKRKASDYSERKKKKQNVSSSINKEANSNEQRLPLKKRHYHLSTNDDTEDSTVSVITKSSTNEKVDAEIKSPSLLLKVANVNNNEYNEPETTVKEHIAEAIEATITRFSSSENLEVCGTIKIEPFLPVSEKLSIPATTPKKRHRLEMNSNKEEATYPAIQPVEAIKDEKVDEEPNVETAVKKGVTARTTPDEAVKKVETPAQVITRKKNRLEDLTLTLAHKVSVQ